MAGSVVREEHAIKTRRVAVTENLKPADGYTALVKAHVLACMCPSGGVVLPMRKKDGGVMIVYGRGGVLDYTGVTVWDDGTCGKPRLAKQGRCDGAAPYCRI